MANEWFDAFVRRAAGESSRRGLIRAGIGALGASALTTIGLSAANHAEAKKKNNNNNNHRRNTRQQLAAICYRGDTLEARKKGFRNRFPGATLGACVCPADRPLACGAGCCPNEFPLCCDSPARGGG